MITKIFGKNQTLCEDGVIEFDNSKGGTFVSGKVIMWKRTFIVCVEN